MDRAPENTSVQRLTGNTRSRPNIPQLEKPLNAGESGLRINATGSFAAPGARLKRVRWNG